ncbi:LacI family DNA-binding transcriptional regulator [Marinicrinis lubricantis]|uniref:LacI family DNA-binding transcriptional regulator n=1 Tax=Marinicrinis lubricantis TaxID=2086470 RepID=A0ABW1IJP7_9BACL
MKPTILDVAKLANVSKATVSRVINHNPKVDKNIRERVEQAIEQLGYRPSAIARNLANNTSNTIGLILPDITNPYFPVLARGIEDQAHRSGYTVIISNTDNDPRLEQEYIQMMAQQQVGGIILISSILEEEKMSELQSLQIPFVLCDRTIENTTFDIVTIDHYRAAFEAVEHLIRQGHQHICHISGPVKVQTAETRKQAYLDAMEAAGLIPVVRVGSFSYEAGYSQMLSILNEYEPSALFAANDLIAFGAINALQSKGMKVPDDVAVIGCDDITFAGMYKPALSTISVPAYQIGATSVELLESRMKGVRNDAKQVVLEHSFSWRETCIGGKQTR